MGDIERQLVKAMAEAPLTLTDDSIHVWQINYRREQRREPLCAMLAAYLDLDVRDVTLVEDEFGRPALHADHHSALDFNWSHSGDQALVAIAVGVAPGIDIERMRERPRALQLAERYFRPDEISMLTALSDAERSLAFLRIWTAKEAVLKALGRGIAFGLDRLQISGEAGGPTLLWMDGDDSSKWQLHRVEVGGGYLGALAWRGNTRIVHRWSLNALS